MKVGVLGSGDVGQALGRGFVSRGHDVKIGSRNPKKAELLAWQKDAKGRGTTGTFEEAARHGEVIVLAVPGTAMEDAVRLAGAKNLSGKVVIDVMNPFDSSQAENPTLFVGLTDSLAERLQRLVPDAKVVKCFNTVPSTQMVDPKFAGGTPEMLICGGDAGAKRKVTGILKEFGWPGAIDVGGIEGARGIEAILPLWVLLGSTLGRWDHAFKVVHG